MIVYDIMHNMTEDERVAAYKEAESTMSLVYHDGHTWDIFAKEEKDGHWYLYAVAKPGSGGSNSHFGTLDHLINLFIKGYDDPKYLTDAGWALIGNVCGQYMTDLLKKMTQENKGAVA